MKRTTISIILSAASLFPLISVAQETGEITREVRLYNPFKPSLNKENKALFLPVIDDTAEIAPLINYSITPDPFIPAYELRTISAARLEPDPLPKLYRGYVDLGFGNYFSPYARISASTIRSRNSVTGFFAEHRSSLSKLKLQNDESVYAGYMDNRVNFTTTRFFNRSALTGDIDFTHLRRHAYGYDTRIDPVPDVDKDSLRIGYINPGAEIGLWSTRTDSAFLDYDVRLKYDLFMQNSMFYRHRGGAVVNAGYDFDIFYADAQLSYELYKYSEAIDFRARHLFSLNPHISRRGSEWSFSLGFSAVADGRNSFDPDGIDPPEYKTKLYFYPDIKFNVTLVPRFIKMYVSLDGEYENNSAADIYTLNPYIVEESPSGSVSPSDELYMIRPTDHKLRAGAGFSGSAGESSSWQLSLSYSLSEDMLFFVNDAAVSGRGLLPAYDNGELLRIKGDYSLKLNQYNSVTAEALYSGYRLELYDHPWHMPSWEFRLKYNYNLRDKILAEASLRGVAQRKAMYGPMLHAGETEPTVETMPAHFSLNLKAEYRYTKLLSFWAGFSNISNNRYYEWNFYPSRRFLFMAGFSYSL
jgi:hypothetical protein